MCMYPCGKLLMDIFRGSPVITFHGTAEWALDYILTTQIVWLPTERQLRQQLEEMLLGQVEIKLQLTFTPSHYQCDILHQGQEKTFVGKDASEAYGNALLFLFKNVAD
ncbi:MAG: hypothetical protein GY943_39715 [Chloroflexi bacterium]|nr:hypothetical protein [Chloroflexota bacterium]